MSTDPHDAHLRQRALDPGRSFLVQAPAGAGKTELLIQRYLGLLAVVQEPEEILAVTFTRKAAGELRSRVYNALAAAQEPGVTTARIAGTDILAQAAVARDAALGWGLLRHPARLRIGTIDGLNAWIARGAPVSSGASVLRRLADRPEPVYREAARQIVRLLADEGPIATAIAVLLAHLDNRVDRLELLLAAMLGRRDQWLPVIGAGPRAGGTLRLRLEAVLRKVVAHRLQLVARAVPAGLTAELRAVVAAAAEARGNESPAPAAGDDGVATGLAWWRFVADTLLTKKGDWRAQLTKTEGFPPDRPAVKQRALELLAVLRPTPGLADALHAVRRLPDPVYPELQWRALEALLMALPMAAAELKLAFSRRGETDFIEIAADAIRALGGDDEPGDATLRLDARIRHVLLDEFQDTSQPQCALLDALTQGWVPGDGRTVFLVGDPMQSIYRFRQAEVRQFLAARVRGLATVKLEFLRLSANFRSAPAVVDWVNQSFSKLFPAADDHLTSAVEFAPSEAVRAAEPGAAVALHDTSGLTRAAEGELVARLVAARLLDSPTETIGILVRSRAHAAGTLAALREARVPVAAVDLLHLGETPIGNDLLALTRALTHRGDRLAWLAVLRAPWCGLTLADLTALAGEDRHGTLWERTGELAVATRLSPDGQARVLRLRRAWERAEARVGRIPLRDVVEGLWLELGGPACAGEDLDYADLVFSYLERHDAGGDCADVLALGADLAAQPASLTAPECRVHLLTIHKAKGLEFDTVIVPGLGYSIRRESRPALLWQELPVADGRPELLLAPINGAGSDHDLLYELLWALQREQALAESDRLLYVAATRAVKHLHLIGHLDEATEAKPRLPARGSLLERLWPAVADGWPAPAQSPGDRLGYTPPAAAPTAGWRQAPLRRLGSGWQRPAPPAPLALPADPPWQAAGRVLYDWASVWAMHAGAVVHRCLQHIAGAGVQAFTPARIRELRPRFRRMLLQAGVDESNLERATNRVCDALVTTLADERGRWVLSDQHREAVSEFALTVAADGRFQQLVVDRAFVSEAGDRWIIDYKTSSHEGGDVAAFLAAETERYREQLAGYRDAFAQQGSERVRTALYFPVLGRFHEVEWPDPAAPVASE